MKYVKYSFWSFIVAVFGWLGHGVHAAGTSLTWSNPTTFLDNTTIPAGDLASNLIFRKVGNGAYSLLKTIPLDTQYVDANLATGVYCYQVSVVRGNGIQSALSNEACKTVDTRVPNTVTITAN